MEIVKKIGQFLFHEFLQVLPPTIFFLVFAHVVYFNTQLMLSQFKVELGATAVVTVTALVIGKVVVVVDKLPFVRKLDTRPLLIPVLFKAIIFTAFVTLVRLAEPWVPALIETGSIAAANAKVGEHYVWRLFTAAQIWIFVGFIIYFTASETFKVFGMTRKDLLIAFFREHPSHMSFSKPNNAARGE